MDETHLTKIQCLVERLIKVCSELLNQIINKTSNSKYMMRNYSIFVAREEKKLARRPKSTVEEQKTNHFKFTYLFHERAREKCLRGGDSISIQPVQVNTVL